MPQYVTTHTDHAGITSIEFFHPQSNSLPGKMLSDLAQEIHHAGLNADTKIIILRSAGEKTFCAGASFEELAAITNEKEGQVFFSGFAHVINAMRTCGKLIIGRIQGKCVGGGVGLAAAVDYAIATEAAEVKLSELAIGIGPFVVGPVIERKREQLRLVILLLMQACGAMQNGPNAKAFLQKYTIPLKTWMNPLPVWRIHWHMQTRKPW